MTQQLRWMVLAVAAALAIGCGGAQVTPDETAEAQPEWTAAQLQKLEPSLRTRVRRGEDERVAVRVFFLELPTDEELSELLLNRMGEQAIGEVAPETLQRIASRSDVERIEALRDVGYPEP